MLEYLRNWHAAELEMLNEAGLANWLDGNPNWDVMLTEWRLKKQIRKLTPYSAKKFAKTR